MPESISSAFGVVSLLVIAFALSTNKRSINWRIVLSAFALQLVFAVIVLYLPPGRAALQAAAAGVNELLTYAGAGISMVFGPLDNVGFSFAINVLPVIVFFAALMSVLYHIGIMPRLVAGFGWLLNKVLGTGRVESLNAAANIFVGQTEAPLTVKPYLPKVTEPQLFAIMVSGLASVAGSVLAGYAQLGISVEYLLAASFMSAPGGLLMAKIIMPDSKDNDRPQDLVHVHEEHDRHANVIMAAAMGAKDGLWLALNIGAMLIAFVSLIALVNGLLGYGGSFFGMGDLTVQTILGYVFAPLMFVLGIPLDEVVQAGGIVGEKIIINEFVAFISLSGRIEEFSPQTQAILTFALCGFANLSSIGILLGGLGSLIPERLGEIARFGLLAVAAGTLSNLMSAALAGLLFQFQ
ncbi:MAG: NupC/NupG family nucleoside CNT transporter [Alphaproteobacteria bacterium]|nr:NupC/NupG family nucleoside CNT transporter [Alphaproteobacteria bacterium]